MDFYEMRQAYLRALQVQLEMIESEDDEKDNEEEPVLI
jgi:hypothetical protein